MKFVNTIGLGLGLIFGPAICSILGCTGLGWVFTEVVGGTVGFFSVRGLDAIRAETARRR